MDAIADGRAPPRRWPRTSSACPCLPSASVKPARIDGSSSTSRIAAIHPVSQPTVRTRAFVTKPRHLAEIKTAKGQHGHDTSRRLNSRAHLPVRDSSEGVAGILRQRWRSRGRRIRRGPQAERRVQRRAWQRTWDPARGRRLWRTAIRRTLFFFAAPFLVPVGCAVVTVTYERTTVPPVSAAAAARASIFYYRDGTELAQVGELDRVPVKLTDVPIYVRDAVLAAEDRGFYHDPVVSPRGLARALWVNLRGGTTQGGSGHHSAVREGRLPQSQADDRAGRSTSCSSPPSSASEQSKDWIFEQYLNTVYFGRGAYGIQAASQGLLRQGRPRAHTRRGRTAGSGDQRAVGAGSRARPPRDDAGPLALRDQGNVGDGRTSRRGRAPVFPSVIAAYTEPLYSGQRGYLIEQVIAELHTLGFTTTRSTGRACASPRPSTRAWRRRRRRMRHSATATSRSGWPPSSPAPARCWRPTAAGTI